MSTVENNPVYYIEEDNKKSSSQVFYKSSNDALLRKVSKHSGRHNKTIRTIVVLVLLIIAVSCFALIHAFASTHEQPAQTVATTHIDSVAIKAISVKVNSVNVEKGDTLWAITNKYAPDNVSIHSYINKLMKINGLTKPILQLGQVLVLP